MVADRINDHVAVVAYDGVTTFELAVALEAFGLERAEITDFYSMSIAAGEDGPLSATFGLTVQPDGGLDLVRAAGTVIVPGWRDRDEPPPDPLIDALTQAHASGARLVSICSGAYVLAATGLLDGRAATTHWRYAAHFQARFPDIRVRPGELFVDNGTVITSAGTAAGIDTCIHIVRHDFGAATAIAVARAMVVSPVRDGGQAQHAAPVHPIGSGHTESIAAAIAAVDDDLAADHTVASMAAVASMSVRTFQRRFRHEMGMPPVDWLIARRIETARSLLERSDATVEAIAVAVGYGDAVSLRHHFRRRLGTTPTAYRRRYRNRSA